MQKYTHIYEVRFTTEILGWFNHWKSTHIISGIKEVKYGHVNNSEEKHLIKYNSHSLLNIFSKTWNKNKMC